MKRGPYKRYRTVRTQETIFEGGVPKGMVVREKIDDPLVSTPMPPALRWEITIEHAASMAHRCRTSRQSGWGRKKNARRAEAVYEAVMCVFLRRKEAKIDCPIGSGGGCDGEFYILWHGDDPGRAERLRKLCSVLPVRVEVKDGKTYLYGEDATMGVQRKPPGPVVPVRTESCICPECEKWAMLLPGDDEFQCGCGWRGDTVVCPKCDGELATAEGDRWKCVEHRGVHIGCGWEGEASECKPRPQV